MTVAASSKVDFSMASDKVHLLAIGVDVALCVSGGLWLRGILKS